jgi:hypothetical protein
VRESLKKPKWYDKYRKKEEIEKMEKELNEAFQKKMPEGGEE